MNKDITNIEYNYLNLPEEVDINGNITEYIYNAGGGKLRHTDGNGNVTDYIGNAVYEYQEGNTPVLSYLISGEGRTLMDGQGPVYEYYMKDHLGNTRVTYTDENANGMIDVNEIDQVSDYYPFGMLHEPRLAGSSNNKYLYNGKEIQEGLEWYDYGARMYDAALGRWFVVDPAAGKYMSYSPYNYCLNSPINLIDPNGKEVSVGPHGGVLFTGEDVYPAYNYYVNNAKPNIIIGRQVDLTINNLDFNKNWFSITADNLVEANRKVSLINSVISIQNIFLLTHGSFGGIPILIKPNATGNTMLSISGNAEINATNIDQLYSHYENMSEKELKNAKKNDPFYKDYLHYGYFGQTMPPVSVKWCHFKRWCNYINFC